MKTQTSWLMCILLALAACLPRNAHAQTDNSDPPPKTYKNHIGGGIISATERSLNTLKLPSLQIMYKRETKKGAWRLMTDFSYLFLDSAAFPASLTKRYVTENIIYLGIGVGYEKHKKISTQLTAYWGADIRVMLDVLWTRYRRDFTPYIVLPDGSEIRADVWARNKGTSLHLQLRPFAGLRYQLSPRFSACAEATLSGTVQNFSVIGGASYFVPNSIVPPTEYAYSAPFRYTTYILGFIPRANFYIFYSF